MNISSYSDLLTAAAAQPEIQRLLFTFARAGLPENAADTEQQRYSEKRGGTLTPVICVDKLTHELSNFRSLVDESLHTGAHWDIVFVTTMSGKNGCAPPQSEAEAPLKMMVAAIEQGDIGNFLAFNRSGELLQFH